MSPKRCPREKGRKWSALNYEIESRQRWVVGTPFTLNLTDCRWRLCARTPVWMMRVTNVGAGWGLAGALAIGRMTTTGGAS